MNIKSIRNLCLASGIAILLSGCGSNTNDKVKTYDKIVIKRGEEIKIVYIDNYIEHREQCTIDGCNLYSQTIRENNSSNLAQICPIGHITNGYEIVGALTEVVNLEEFITKEQLSEIKDNLPDYVKNYKEKNKIKELVKE